MLINEVAVEDEIPPNDEDPFAVDLRDLRVVLTVEILDGVLIDEIVVDDEIPPDDDNPRVEILDKIVLEDCGRMDVICALVCDDDGTTDDEEIYGIEVCPCEVETVGNCTGVVVVRVEGLATDETIARGVREEEDAVETPDKVNEELWSADPEAKGVVEEAATWLVGSDKTLVLVSELEGRGSSTEAPKLALVSVDCEN